MILVQPVTVLSFLRNLESVEEIILAVLTTECR